MSENTNTPQIELNKIIDKIKDSGPMSKNEACKLIGQALGKLARRGRPYNDRYVASLSNGSKTITPAMSELISRVGGYMAKPKRDRFYRQIIFTTAEELADANTLSMEECRQAIKNEVARKRVRLSRPYIFLDTRILASDVRQRIGEIEEGR
ncbi:MAG: hypothetical protein KAJ07_04675 [Planctomycetes bacterium]|nr:hypothetical protein [Planctomycetota bacterium]